MAKKKTDDIPKDDRIIAMGQLLGKLMEEKGYANKEHFAWDFKMNRVTVYNLISGKDFRMSTLLKMLDVLEVDVKDFFAQLDTDK